MSSLEIASDVASVAGAVFTSFPIIERAGLKLWAFTPNAKCKKWNDRLFNTLQIVVPDIDKAPIHLTVEFLVACNRYLQSKQDVEAFSKTSTLSLQSFRKGYRLAKDHARVGRQARDNGLQISQAGLLAKAVCNFEHPGIMKAAGSCICNRPGRSLAEECAANPVVRKQIEELRAALSIEFGISLAFAFQSGEETQTRTENVTAHRQGVESLSYSYTPEPVLLNNDPFSDGIIVCNITKEEESGTDGAMDDEDSSVWAGPCSDPKHTMEQPFALTISPDILCSIEKLQTTMEKLLASNEKIAQEVASLKSSRRGEDTPDLVCQPLVPSVVHQESLS